MLNRRALSSVEDNQSIIDVLSNPKIRVGVLANTSYVGFAKKLLPKATLIEFESWDKFKMSLKEGKIDAAFRDDCELSKLLKQFPDFNFNFSIYSLKEEVDPIFVVLGLECELFRKWLQELMDADKTMSYELKTVMEKYKNNL